MMHRIGGSVQLQRKRVQKMDRNERIVNDFYKSIVEGDMELYSSLIHENIELSLPIRKGVLTGTYFGKTRLVEEIFPLVISCLDLDNFTFCKRFKIMSSNEHCVAAICEAGGLASSGEPYDQIYAHFFKFEDEKIIKLIEFQDSSLADRALWRGVAYLEPDSQFSY